MEGANKKADGFTFVTYKRKRKTNYKCTPDMCVKTPENNPMAYEVEKKRYKTWQVDLEVSNFFAEFKYLLGNILDEWECRINNLYISKSNEPIDIICYGLGSFSSCITARHQLVFLMALRDFLEVKNVSLYDPVFSVHEKVCLAELGFNVLTVNEDAKRTIAHKTIFFMPHCDLPMYNNLLWSNWSITNLSRLLVIGNTFSDYDRVPSLPLKKICAYISYANEFVTEKKILNNYVFLDVFNDMSIHYFESEALSKVSDRIWLETKEPLYCSEPINQLS